MVSSTLILSCVLLAAVTEANIKGAFKDSAGVKCKYYENRHGGGKGPRSMVINCGSTYSCSYKGNPHSCKWYNKNHQPQFYQCLVADVLKFKTACSAPSIECSKKCPNVVMTRQAFDMGLLRQILLGEYNSNDVLQFGDDEFGDDEFGDDEGKQLEFDNYY